MKLSEYAKQQGVRYETAHFGARYIDILLKGQGRTLEAVNLADNATKDVLADLTSIIYLFLQGSMGKDALPAKQKRLSSSFKQRMKRNAVS